MVKIQEYTNMCIMLQYKVFTIETPELQRVKVNFTLEEATKAQKGVEVQLYCFFKLGFNGGRCSQRHAPAALLPGKTRYPLYRRLVAPQFRSGQVRKISFQPGFV